MPRSSRHKSSKHSSRDAIDYSDSEKESSLKERKGKEESSARVAKESGSSDKRKLDSKDKEYYDSVNGEYFEEYTSSKRRKEKIEDGVNDRWNGGDDDRGESSRKSKTSSEKSRRREEIEGEETKRSSSKSDGKHRESSRRESREVDKERDRDRDRKHKEGRSERYLDSEDNHGTKGVSDKTDWNARDQLQSPGSENYHERRARRKRDDYGDGDKHQDSVNDASDRLLASRDDDSKDGRQKEEKLKDEKYRDKYREDIDKDNKHGGDKQRDDRPGKDHANTRSDEKLLRDEKDASESKRKKSRLQENDHDHGHEPDSEHDGYRDRPRDYERSRDYEREYDRGRDRERERDRDRVRDHERDRDRDRDRDHERERDRDRGDYERDRYHERDRDRGRSRDRDWDHDRDRNRDRERDRSRDYYYDRERSKSDREREFDRDLSHLDDQSGRYKDSRERRRSPDDRDDLSDGKSRAITAHRDIESRSGKAHPDGERIRSQSRQPSSLHGDQEEFGHNQDQRSRVISSRDAADLSGGSDRVSKYRSSEKSTKMEDGNLGELLVERSSSTKASPRGLVERSPSSTGHERRYMNRSGARRSLEVEETGQRSNTRELSASEDRLGQDLPPEKPPGDELSLGELTFNNKVNQNSPALLPRPESRGGVGSPLVGSLEEDNRVNTGGRYKRGGDPNMGRGQGNAWRGAPNWPSPVPNGFIPFQHGPPHGGFQSIMPQFPSPSLFGVRPSMEMSHSGIPYHMPDAERFSGHLRPLGWQNMMDGSGPSQMHGWDIGNGLFRDDPHMYGGAEWEHSRRMHGRGWEPGADAWKTQNGDASMDVSSMSLKDDHSAQAADDDVAGQTSQSESNRAKSVEAGSNLTSPAKEMTVASPKTIVEEESDHPAAPMVDDADRYCRYYLSKIDISVELADAEVQSQCVNLLMDEQRAKVDDGTGVLVNLKSGGKAVPKRDYSCMLTLSLFPNANNSVFERAMELYKEQRVETKDASTVEDEEPSLHDKGGGGGDVNDAKKGDDDISVPTADVEMEDGSDLTPSEKKTETVSPPPDDADEEAEKRSSGPSQGNPSEAMEASEEAKTDMDGDETNATTEEESVAEDADEGRENGTEKEGAEEKACVDGGVVVEDDASGKVSGTLIPESNESESESESESVISRIHHSPQSTH